MRIDDESAHSPALFAREVASFIRRIKKSLVRMNGEETRADRFGGQLRRAQPAARRIEAEDINPFTLPAGVSADVNKELLWVGRRPGGVCSPVHLEPRRASEYDNCEQTANGSPSPGGEGERFPRLNFEVARDPRRRAGKFLSDLA